jgi:4-hydroxy-4-methyl-2-oxoglutarate aldolase
MYKIITDIERPDLSVVDQFRGIGTAELADAMGKYRVGCIDPKIKAVVPHAAFVGTAFTVKTHEGNNLIIHKAVTLTKPGDAIVVDAGQNENIAVWGGTFSQICKLRGLSGAVIDGAVRDLRAMIETGFPVFARSVSPAGPMRAPGSINVPISCGGVLVFPGDVVVCDDDGGVVIPKGRLHEVLEKARILQDKGREMSRLVDAGEYPINFLGLAELLDKAEIRVVRRGERD